MRIKSHYVKYFWRNVVENLNDAQNSLLATRLSSISLQGLGLQLPHLAGRTLVKHAKSLVGRDFRAVIQVAPFVLFDLLPEECYQTWLALSSLVPLIWQPLISDLETYLVRAHLDASDSPQLFLKRKNWMVKSRTF